jgi:hypothetical protein
VVSQGRDSVGRCLSGVDWPLPNKHRGARQSFISRGFTSLNLRHREGSGMTSKRRRYRGGRFESVGLRSAESSYEVKIEPGQRRANLMHCAALRKAPEVNSHEANAIDQIDHGFLSFAIVS